MILSAAGTWGALAVGVAVLGLPMQLAIAWMLARRRPMSLMVALSLPLLVLGLGELGSLAALGDGLHALDTLADPAYAPFFAIHDRAAALAPASLAGFAAAALAFFPAVGVAAAALREPERSLLGLSILLPAAAVALFLGALGAIAGADPRWALPLAGFGLAAFAAAAGVTLSVAKPQPFAGPAVAVGAFVVAAIALGGGAVAAVECELAESFADFSDPWAAVVTIAEATPAAGRAQALALIATGVALVGVLPAMLLVRVSRIRATAALDLAALAAAITSLLVGGAWIALRRAVLGRLAAAFPLAVLQAASVFDVPHAQPVPPRVLVAESVSPRWLALREGGGVSVDAVPVLDDVGPTVKFGDGLVLSPMMTAEELYLLLAGSDAGRVAVVGCDRHGVPVDADPVLAAGRCGSFPLLLRVTDSMESPRVLILLKEHYVDDGGDVVPLPDVKELAGRDVLLRMQGDALLSDLVVALRAVANARHVYLAWGVDLDGSDIPVGVNPRLRIAAP